MTAVITTVITTVMTTVCHDVLFLFLILILEGCRTFCFCGTCRSGCTSCSCAGCIRRVDFQQFQYYFNIPPQNLQMCSIDFNCGVFGNRSRSSWWLRATCNWRHKRRGHESLVIVAIARKFCLRVCPRIK